MPPATRLPVAVRGFARSTGHPKAFTQAVGVVRQKFAITVVLVADRRMTTGARIKALKQSLGLGRQVETEPSDPRAGGGGPARPRWRPAAPTASPSPNAYPRQTSRPPRDHVQAILRRTALRRFSWSYGIGYCVWVFVVDGDTRLLRSQRVGGI
jgi:hypothetical protein